MSHQVAQSTDHLFASSSKHTPSHALDASHTHAHIYLLSVVTPILYGLV